MFLYELGELLSRADELFHHGITSKAASWTSLSREMHSALGEDAETFDPMLDERSALANVVWDVEQYLGLLARASLILYPAAEGPKRQRGQPPLPPEVATRYKRRGERLCSLLFPDLFESGTEHAIKNRDLRNRWMHSDEYLNDALESLSPSSPRTSIQPTRIVDEAKEQFDDSVLEQMRDSPSEEIRRATSSMLASEDRRKFVLRQFTPDKMTVVFLGTAFALRPLQDALDDLLPRVVSLLEDDDRARTVDG